MKAIPVILVAAAVGFVVAWMILSLRLDARQAALVEQQQAALLAEKNALEATLKAARSARPNEPLPPPARVLEPAKRPAAGEILEQLKRLNISPGPGTTRDLRQVVRHFENLIQLGPPALPDIRRFLASPQDMEYDPEGGRGPREVKTLMDGLVPPSLRFGLFDVTRQIGGAEGEKILAEALCFTGRSLEVAWLVRVLEEAAPRKYRDTSLNIAHQMLTDPATTNPAGPPDRFARDYLYGVLIFLGDNSFVDHAQAQLLRVDGAVEPGALKYLQQQLGEQVLPVVAQAYRDPRLTDPAKREPLAVVIGELAGVNPTANEMFRGVVNDSGLPLPARRQLIENLADRGYQNLPTPTPRDLKLMQARLELIDQYRNDVTDKIITGAFATAETNLKKILDRPPPKP